MDRTLRRSALALLAVLAMAGIARAQDAGFELVDRGRLVAFHGDTPIATERFLYERSADTLVILAHASRRQTAEDGTVTPYVKSMTLIARADDFGLVRYASTETFGKHRITRNITPNDTLIVVDTDVDQRGAGNSIERPPGRFFAIDPGLFTLFDIVGRNLHGRIYGPRPVQLVVLGEEAQSVQATATPAGNDTVTWGGRRVVTERVTLADSSGTFTLWLSPEGHLLRFEDPARQISVVREEPAPPPAVKRRRPATR